MDQGDFDIEIRDTSVVLRPTMPSLMEAGQIEAFEKIGKAQVQPGHTSLIIDFANVQYVSSRLVGALLSLRKASVAAGGTVTLVGMNVALLELVKLVRLDKMFAIKPTRSAAA